MDSHTCLIQWAIFRVVELWDFKRPDNRFEDLLYMLDIDGDLMLSTEVK